MQEGAAPGRSDPTVRRAGVERVAELRPVYESLLAHHREFTTVPLAQPDSRAWFAREAVYTEALRGGRAVLHVADADGAVVGYALTIVHDGQDDFFPLAPRYAELYTLAVLPQVRGRGVGTALLDAVDEHLAASGIRTLTVAVSVGNDAAMRLYRRRGLVPAETVLHRTAPA